MARLVARLVRGPYPDAARAGGDRAGHRDGLRVRIRVACHEDVLPGPGVRLLAVGAADRRCGEVAVCALDVAHSLALRDGVARGIDVRPAEVRGAGQLERRALGQVYARAVAARGVAGDGPAGQRHAAAAVDIDRAAVLLRITLFYDGVPGHRERGMRIIASHIDRAAVAAVISIFRNVAIRDLGVVLHLKGGAALDIHRAAVMIDTAPTSMAFLDQGVLLHRDGRAALGKHRAAVGVLQDHVLRQDDRAVLLSVDDPALFALVVERDPRCRKDHVFLGPEHGGIALDTVLDRADGAVRSAVIIGAWILRLGCRRQRQLAPDPVGLIILPSQGILELICLDQHLDLGLRSVPVRHALEGLFVIGKDSVLQIGEYGDLAVVIRQQVILLIRDLADGVLPPDDGFARRVQRIDPSAEFLVLIRLDAFHALQGMRVGIAELRVGRPRIGHEDGPRQRVADKDATPSITLTYLVVAIKGFGQPHI